MKIFLYLFFISFFLSCSSSVKEHDAAENIHINLKHMGGHNFELFVENKGNIEFMIPHLTSEIYNEHGLWGGFSINARPIESKIWVYMDYGRFEIPNKNDFIKLSPGKYYSVELNLERLARRHYEEFREEYPLYFSGVSGEYIVQASLALISKSSVSYPRDVENRNYGLVKSNSVHVLFE